MDLMLFEKYNFILLRSFTNSFWKLSITIVTIGLGEAIKNPVLNL